MSDSQFAFILLNIYLAQAIGACDWMGSLKPIALLVFGVVLVWSVYKDAERKLPKEPK